MLDVLWLSIAVLAGTITGGIAEHLFNARKTKQRREILKVAYVQLLCARCEKPLSDGEPVLLLPGGEAERCGDIEGLFHLKCASEAALDGLRLGYDGVGRHLTRPKTG